MWKYFGNGMIFSLRSPLSTWLEADWRRLLQVQLILSLFATLKIVHSIQIFLQKWSFYLLCYMYIHIVLDWDRKRDKEQDWEQRVLIYYAVMFKTGTGTRTHCFLMWQSHFLHGPWSRSHAVWISYYCVTDMFPRNLTGTKHRGSARNEEEVLLTLTMKTI